MQTLYNISTAPCNSNSNLFGNPSCFFMNRTSTLFASSDCISKGNSLQTQIQNLVGFGVAAGEALDAYMQNIQNYLGALLVFNTNISTFYTNSNLTSMFASFSEPAVSLLSNTSCEYISSTFGNIYKGVDASSNSLLNVVVLTFSACISSFVVMVISFCMKARWGEAKVTNEERPLELEEPGIHAINMTQENIRDEVMGAEEGRMPTDRGSLRGAKKRHYNQVNRMDTI